jgi:hypothetical protein
MPNALSYGDEIRQVGRFLEMKHRSVVRDNRPVMVRSAPPRPRGNCEGRKFVKTLFSNGLKNSGL